MNNRDRDPLSGRPSPAPAPHRNTAASLYLTARFLSLPDVQITIPDPGCVTIVGLKMLIRRELVRKAAQAAIEASSLTGLSPDQHNGSHRGKEKEKEEPVSPSPTLQDAHRRRLRIIYAGKILADNVVLAHVLRPVPPPPRAVRPTSSPGGSQTHTGSGAQPGTGTQTPLDDGAAMAGRVYVNCSIDDIMSARELSAEADAAATAAVLYGRRSEAGGPTGTLSPASASGASVPGHAGGRSSSGPMSLGSTHRRGTSGGQAGGSGFVSATPEQQQQQQQQGNQSATGGWGGATTPAPRGFDRLLQAGFTLAEVNQLRLQFNTIQAARFTPDTMPSPDSMRNMEDSWLDNSGSDGLGASVGAAGSGGPGGTGGGVGDDGNPLPDDAGLPGMLETMVRAMVVGFVFPLGSMSWLMREEGLWTPRWRMFVSMGVVVSLMIGSVKTLAGEW
ncbi:hypothetical protein SEPCBS119000_000883 [Sporothrix epigloea]|uniref:Ubiquitin-like domain-containing protein n=1 Tax=Sporothrix epigloea TaxID=1892477 RepID=A0ABP0D7Q0_9PEZI